MSFKNLFESGEHKRNLSHFASIVNMASVHGEIHENEQKLLERFAKKLNISSEQYAAILKDPSQYPINPPNDADTRLSRMLDLFKIIFADFEIDDEERKLIERYAIGLGYSEESAERLIEKSIKIFSGGLDLEDYRYLLNKN